MSDYENSCHHQCHYKHPTHTECPYQRIVLSFQHALVFRYNNHQLVRAVKHSQPVVVELGILYGYVDIAFSPFYIPVSIEEPVGNGLQRQVLLHRSLYIGNGCPYNVFLISDIVLKIVVAASGGKTCGGVQSCVFHFGVQYLIIICESLFVVAVDIHFVFPEQVVVFCRRVSCQFNGFLQTFNFLFPVLVGIFA